ncbi:alpha-galactosidase [Flavobacterium glycines]|uniref:Alpha-galactosidase n=1 Tax=Flavobacterium glycines TaxID=551990 RepID=A0A1B9DRJ3_9FLAO|nr:alpha-galactosidase [Flavobacterium glycines]OCB72301.1 alpha-galactosidase [Flavobacterium glycines]GEL09769.1 alpha-galactosidase [Flavobacterium glycines]SDI94418.1 alpha-galactosidase [Flavobacterium glycines]
MKKDLVFSLLKGNFKFVVVFFYGLLSSYAQNITIPIETKDHALVLQTDNDKRLRNIYFGKPLKNKAEYDIIAKSFDFNDANAGIYNIAYTPSGTSNLSEPALQVKHADGNTSLELKYVSHKYQKIDADVTLISIVLKDPVYPFEVTLFYKVWAAKNVIEQWTEIKHQEKKAVLLQKYASANMYFTNKNFYLTSFQGEYLKEMQPVETKLEQGIKVIDSKLGTRAMLLQTPNFMVSFGQPASENEGLVMLGQLAWSGNFKLDFEIDSYKNLRLIAGINPYASEYSLVPNRVFKTPSLIYALSNEGTGEASRNLHEWARKYRVLDGEGERLTLLNNWEATYFDFDEAKIKDLFKGAKSLGVDMFLLDDGWFGNKYPRNNDDAGLGDWQENKKKLPHGLGYLVKEAQKEGVKFGIWIEPEMVNPRSELYEKHLDWVIRQPERPEIYYRNQLVLDLSNPEVQDFVFGIVDNLFTKNPELAFIKWDCNAVIYNAYSAFLNQKGIPQSNLYVDYIHGLYKVLERIRAKYPKVPMMLCSGGGGRGDYEFLKYFTEFWPSDDTDPIERIFIQWNYSYFFPSITTDNHVTDWGKQPLKFRVDVASMGKLGFDIVESHLSENDKVFCKQAISNYNSFKDIVWHGDLYRLLNPHENDISSLMYVNKEKNKAVVFNYLVNNRYKITATERPIVLAGLDPDSKYTVKEINLYPDTKSTINSENLYSGNFLMTVGINPNVTLKRTSVILEITQVK